MKKKLSIGVVGLLLLVQVLQGLGMLTAAYAKEVTDNLITNVALTAKDGSGNTVTDAVYEQGASVQLDFDWKLDNGHDYTQGDTFTFDLLPADKFVMFNNVEGDLVINGSDNVGAFVVDKDTRKVTMTFNEFISNYDEVHGKLTVNARFDKQKITGSSKQVIKFPTQGGEQEIPVEFKPNVDTTIDKTGSPDKRLNGQNISWVINLNKKLETIENAVLTDPIPDGLELNQGTIELYHLDVNLDGSVVAGGQVDASKYSIVKTQDGKDFQIKFSDSSINQAYQLRYTTKITSGTNFTNTAILSGTNYQDATASATVGIKYGDLLKKKAVNYDPVHQTIDWEINYNFGEQAIPQQKALLSDAFTNTDTQSLEELAVYEVTFDSSGNMIQGSKVSNYTLTDNHQGGFELQFNSDITSAYVIKYRTKVSVPVYEDATVTNKVTSDGQESWDDQGIIQLFGKKTNGNVDYVNKTVDWKITLNGNRLPVNSVVIEDAFPNGGLELIPDSLQIDGQPVVSGGDYEINYKGTPADHKLGFELKFNKPIATQFTITYTTKFNTDWVTGSGKSMPNHAAIRWKDSGGTDHSITAVSTFDPNSYTKNNGYKLGSYNPKNKEITWTLGVNYNLKQISKPQVVDTLLQDQKLDESSLEVHKMNIDASSGKVSSGDIIPASEYSLKYDEQSNVMTVSFNKEINEGYILTFKTSMDGNLIDRKIENQAVLMDGTKQVSENLKASVTVPHGGEYVTKTGKQAGELINWSIVINEGQSHVAQAKIIDTPTSNQVLLPESYHLYSTKVDDKGNVIKSDELLRDTDYSIVSGTNDQGEAIFTLSFNKDIDEAYILEYQSLIKANDGEKVTNKVKFEGNNIKTVTSETSEEVIVGVTSGSGTGSGKRGELTVTKTDKEDPGLFLQGAVFELYRNMANGSSILVDTQTTDEYGKAVFTKLLVGNYKLKEITAPRGYQVLPTEYPITISSSDLNPAVTVENQKTPTEPSPGPTDPNPTPVDPNPTPVNPNPTPVDPSPTPVNPNPTPSPTIPTQPGPAPTPVTPEPTPVPVTPEPTTPILVPGDQILEPTPTKPDAQPAEDPDLVDLNDDTPTGGISDSPDDHDKGGDTSSKPMLPKTGEESYFMIQLLGITLIMLGIAGAVIFKKSKISKNAK
ncbi:cell wall protein [Paenibacillus sp. CAA11]|uniref:LPXTG cell wall anchor domain-containing protein n=1 Tax=Paenibacillus sp. CAA11 TaxID=1532905 RepID=UPI000D3B0BCC|nr:LPXTG cell wall anchor domain-containing protein [Paenibacillus sp. CAA11]AWB44569.1 cell wall protein [Paenibacillus sp. CAA11]